MCVCVCVAVSAGAYVRTCSGSDVKRHVVGRARVSDSRDQNIVPGEREWGFVTLLILSLLCGYAAVICRHDVSRRAKRLNGKKGDVFSFDMINLRLNFPAAGLGNIFPLRLANLSCFPNENRCNRLFRGTDVLCGCCGVVPVFNVRGQSGITFCI